jgi:hypothetical protein
MTNSQYYSEEEMEAQLEEAIRRSMQDQTIGKSHAVPSQLQSEEEDPMETEDPSISVPQSTENSYYYAPPPNVGQPPSSVNPTSMYSSAMEAMLAADMAQPMDNDDADDEAPTPSGTLTPTEDGASTAASFVGSQAEDIARMSDFHSMADEEERDMDARSEAESEAFSMVGDGTHTPGSWTDVESEAGDEEGHQERRAPHISHV